MLCFSLSHPDESKAESDHTKEPVEQLKAELAELRTLFVDQAKHKGMQGGKLELPLIACCQRCVNKCV